MEMGEHINQLPQFTLGLPRVTSLCFEPRIYFKNIPVMLVQCLHTIIFSKKKNTIDLYGIQEQKKDKEALSRDLLVNQREAPDDVIHEIDRRAAKAQLCIYFSRFD